MQWFFHCFGMGQTFTKSFVRIDDKYLKPQGLYHMENIDMVKVRKIILQGKLAPFYPGADEGLPYSELEECPICFLHYPVLNTSRCCRKRVCTECFLQVQTSGTGIPSCPFCKEANFAAKLIGPRTKEEKESDRMEEQRVEEARVREREAEVQRDQERSLRRDNSTPHRSNSSTGVNIATTGVPAAAPAASARDASTITLAQPVSSSSLATAATHAESVEQQGFPDFMVPGDMNTSQRAAAQSSRRPDGGSFYRMGDYIPSQAVDMALTVDDLNDLLLEQAIYQSLIKDAQETEARQQADAVAEAEAAEAAAAAAAQAAAAGGAAAGPAGAAQTAPAGRAQSLTIQVPDPIAVPAAEMTPTEPGRCNTASRLERAMQASVMGALGSPALSTPSTITGQASSSSGTAAALNRGGWNTSTLSNDSSTDFNALASDLWPSFKELDSTTRQCKEQDEFVLDSDSRASSLCQNLTTLPVEAAAQASHPSRSDTTPFIASGPSTAGPSRLSRGHSAVSLEMVDESSGSSSGGSTPDSLGDQQGDAITATAYQDVRLQITELHPAKEDSASPKRSGVGDTSSRDTKRQTFEGPGGTTLGSPRLPAVPLGALVAELVAHGPGPQHQHQSVQMHVLCPPSGSVQSHAPAALPESRPVGTDAGGVYEVPLRALVVQLAMYGEPGAEQRTVPLMMMAQDEVQGEVTPGHGGTVLVQQPDGSVSIMAVAPPETVPDGDAALQAAIASGDLELLSRLQQADPALRSVEDADAALAERLRAMDAAFARALLGADAPPS